MRLALGWLLAGALAVLLAAQLAATQQLSISKQTQKTTTPTTADDNGQTQDKQSKPLWEGQQERRLLVRRASGFRADPMLANTRRGGLGGLGSSARSIGDPSLRSAFFSKRRRLHSQARSASTKARAMARPSARTSARSAARSAARSSARSAFRSTNKRSVVPGAGQRGRLRSGARSMSGRRARRLRNSRRFTGWQGMQLARFKRSPESEENDEGAQMSHSFDESLASTPATARASFAPFLQAPKIVQQQQQPCSCPSQVAASQRDASHSQAEEALEFKAQDAQLDAQFKDGHHQKSEQFSEEPAPVEALARAQTTGGLADRQTVDKAKEQLNSLEKTKKGAGKDNASQVVSREPHGDLVMSDGSGPLSGAGSSVSPRVEGEAKVGADEDDVRPETQRESPRAGLVDGLAKVVGAADKEADLIVDGSVAKLPGVGKAVDGLKDGLDLEKAVEDVKSGVNDVFGAARTSSPQAETTGKVDDAAEQSLGQETAGHALDSLKQNTRPPVEAEVELEAPRASNSGQQTKEALEQLDDRLPVESALKEIVNEAGKSDSPRANQPDPQSDTHQSQAEATISEPVKSLPKASVSLEQSNSGAQGLQEGEAKLSGSLTRPGGKEAEAKLDEQINNTEPNPAALEATKRGPALLDAIGDKIKHKLETPELKQEVKPAVGSDGQPQVLAELQRERDEREQAQKWQQQEQEAGKQGLQKTESEQEDHHHQVEWSKPEQQQQAEISSVSSAGASGSEAQIERPAAKALEANVEQASETLGQKKLEESAQEQVARQPHQQQPTEQPGQVEVAGTLTPGTKPLPPAVLEAHPKQTLKSAKGVNYKNPLSKAAAAAAAPEVEAAALYESPRIDRFPAKCASKLFDLSGVLNEILTLIERLGQRVLANSSIDYLTRDSLSRKLAMVRAFAEEARMQANLGQLRRLNDSARAAGVELMRLANWSVAHKLDKSLRPLALQTRKSYIAYRKSCKGVGSS